MSKFAIISHGWFLHLGRTRLYQNAAKISLINTVIPQMTDDQTGIAIYSAPELEAKATADAIAAATISIVTVDESLSDERGAKSLNELIEKLIAATGSAILVTHRRRLRAILKTVRAALGDKLRTTGHRPFFRNQSLLIDPERLTVKVISII